MSSVAETRRVVRTSPHAVVVPVGSGTYAVWNRYFPDVILMNRRGAALLSALREGHEGEVSLEPTAEKELLSHRLVFDGEEDPYEGQFARMIDDAVSKVRRAISRFYRERRDYAVLYLTNDPCNLSCTYCVHRVVQSKSQPRDGNRRVSYEERVEATLRVVDQYMGRKRSVASRPAVLSFNGGEILLDWPLVQRIVEHLEKRHPDVPVSYTLNTNMTLMTEEIAEFLAARSFNVFVSIDGYGAAHDRTRAHRNGRGSFRDVLRNISLFNAASPRNPIEAFQGTIEDGRTFRRASVFGMARFGFRSARLAPNLLGATPEDGRRKARLISLLFAESEGRGLQVYDEYFKNIEALLSNSGDSFLPNCNGLSGDPAHGLQFNLSRLLLSQCCQFLPEAFSSWAEVKGDIYSRRLGAAAQRALTRRLTAFGASCRGCDVAGVCRGGCVLNGLDSWAHRNSGACSYQRELWLDVVRRAARRQVREEEREKGASETGSEAGDQEEVDPRGRREGGENRGRK